MGYEFSAYQPILFRCVLLLLYFPCIANTLQVFGGNAMSSARHNAKIALIVVLGLIVLAAVFFGGRGSAANTAVPIARATPTRIIPTPTPALQTPRILKAFTVSYAQLTNDMYMADCPTCDTISFTSNSPFILMAACDNSVVVGVRIELKVLNSSGHVLDDIVHACNDWLAVPENLPAGNYQVQLNMIDQVIPLSLIVLDASAQ
jgi:hypothetical protein